MEYRKLPHGDEQISVIGLGGGSLPEDVDKATEILNVAIDNDINFFDVGPSYQSPFYAFGRAFVGRREKVITQMHFGAIFEKIMICHSREFCTHSITTREKNLHI